MTDYYSEPVRLPPVFISPARFVNSLPKAQLNPSDSEYDRRCCFCQDYLTSAGQGTDDTENAVRLPCGK